MGNFKELKGRFNNLSESEQDLFLSDLFRLSKETQLFLESRLGNVRAVTKEYIRQMECETIGKVYRRGVPGTPNGKIVNAIITRACKSRVDTQTMMELQKLAFRGFVEFLNEYGGGPESFEEQACNHLGSYLQLVRQDQDMTSEERNRIFLEIKAYLIEKNNMLTDDLDATYEEVTGISIRRSSWT